MKAKSIYSKLLKKHSEEIALGLLIVGLSCTLYFVGCGDTQFMYTGGVSCSEIDLQGLDNPNCSEDTPANLCGPGSLDPKCHKNTPTAPEDPKYVLFSNSYSMGKIDILFVVDNSRSMYQEQQNISKQFGRFLDSIEHLNYRIAITTVDTSDSPGNRNRYYQDGKFIRMGGRDSLLWLENRKFSDSYRHSHKDNVEMFEKGIERDESFDCLEDPKECPDDERAICALNLAFDRNDQLNFFRPTGHLMVVILSDEDERSSQEYIEAQSRYHDEDYSLTSCDDPYTFYRNVVSKVGKHKSVSVHSIIIPPGDRSCLKEQDDENGRGYYGEVYEQFSRPSKATQDRYPFVLDGQVISICKRNYGRQLGQLSEYIADVQSITLPCIPQQVNHIRLKGDHDSYDVEYKIEGRNLIIEEGDIPLNSRVHVSILCSKG